MNPPRKDKDDLWAEFLQKSGADRYRVTGKSAAIGLVVVVVLLVVIWWR